MGDLDVALAAGHHRHRHLRQVAEHYAAVIGGGQVGVARVGQRQLLSFARAVVADPRILVLDEATANVDTQTEVVIQRALKRILRNRTSFVIAHRLSTIRDADLILVMNHGTIIEKGKHEELLEQKGFYADLYNSQFTARSLVEEAV